MPFRIAGVRSSDPLWLLHAVETTAALHYPQGAPRGIVERLAALRKAAEDMAYYGDLLAVMLWHEGAEGIEQEPAPHLHDDAEQPSTGPDDEENEDDSDGDEWKGGVL